MSGKTGTDGKGRRDKASPKPPKPLRKGPHGSDVGRALRSAYDDAVREPVPDEFLDLLGKLG